MNGLTLAINISTFTDFEQFSTQIVKLVSGFKGLPTTEETDQWLMGRRRVLQLLPNGCVFQTVLWLNVLASSTSLGPKSFSSLSAGK
jgi:hypothetical protein